MKWWTKRPGRASEAWSAHGCAHHRNYYFPARRSMRQGGGFQTCRLLVAFCQIHFEPVDIRCTAFDLQLQSVLPLNQGEGPDFDLAPFIVRERDSPHLVANG